MHFAPQYCAIRQNARRWLGVRRAECDNPSQKWQVLDNMQAYDVHRLLRKREGRPEAHRRRGIADRSARNAPNLSPT